MGLFSRHDSLEQLVRKAVEGVFSGLVSDAGTSISKFRTLQQLEAEIEKLRLEKGRKQWEYDRREMEVEHKVGLERKRQEFEIQQAKREAAVTIREENLTTDTKRYQEQMGFHQERFSQEIGYLRKMVEQMLTDDEVDISIKRELNGEKTNDY